MPTIIQHVDDLPESACHETDERGIVRVWCQTTDGYAMLMRKDSGVSFRASTEGTPMDVLERKGWAPVDPSTLGGENDEILLTDEYHLQHSRIWSYWLTAPREKADGVRQFVAGVMSGALPDDWNEKQAETEKKDVFLVFDFSLTMADARGLGSQQRALSALASLPDNVDFFQAVSSIKNLSGVTRKSQQPYPIDAALYEPGELYQTSHSDAAEGRGSPFAESDVLSITGLTLR